MENSLMKGKMKFLRRFIVVDSQDKNILQKARQKGIYVRCVNDLDMANHLGEVNLRKHKYLKGKYVNCLKKVEIKRSGRFEWYNVLKNARNLENVNLIFARTEIFEVAGFAVRFKKSIDKLLQCIKKLPKGIKYLNIKIDELEVEKGHLNKIYRAVGSFKHLETYKRMLGFQPPDVSYVFKELLLIKNYLSKARELKNFGYNFRRDHPKSIQDQHEFLALMKYGRQCPWVTDFKLYLEPDVMLNVDLKEETSVDYTEEEREKYEENQWEDDYDAELEEEEFEDDEEEEVLEEEEDDETEEEKVNKLKEEIATFYRFDLFPNLKKLHLELSKGCFYPLDSFVVKGFSALKSLKHLVVAAKDRPQGTKYLFEGFLEVPLLEMFHLKMPFMKKEDWDLLKRFFDKQVDLQAITLDIFKNRSTKEGYLEQNRDFAEYVGGYLSKKPKLEYVCLRSKILTVEALSETLKRVEIKDQLKLLSVSVFDDHLTTEKSASERVKGLCDFIISQKGSLCYLSVNLLFILEAEVLQRLTRAIPQIKILRMLEFYINADQTIRDESIKFFKNVLKEANVVESYPKCESYFVEVAEMLKKLQTVDDLALYQYILQSKEENLKDEFIEILRALPEMKKLRNLDLSIPFKKISDSFLKETRESLLGLTDLSTVAVETGGHSLFFDKPYDYFVQNIVRQVNQRQYLRTDLMF